MGEEDVILLVYAPWCGFSKKFFPVWTAFSRAVEKVLHLVVAKLDGDRNSSPYPEDISWTAYPTISYFRAGDRTPTMFHANRTVESLVAFVKDKSSKPMEDLDSTV